MKKLILSILLMASALMADTNSSNLFGSYLFKGDFAKNKTLRHNDQYKVSIGDKISIKIWGSVSVETDVTVDAQGNVFIPKIGTVSLLGVDNKKINDMVTQKVKTVYTSNVYCYADLKEYQPVSVFVTGYVNNPGLYDGSSSDSILQFIDKANGIKEQGSFRSIKILRNGDQKDVIDLYEFILTGKATQTVFNQGDVIFVSKADAFVKVSNEDKSVILYEIKEKDTVKNLVGIYKSDKIATDAIIKNFKNKTTEIVKVPVNSNQMLTDGDEISFVSEYNNLDISVNVSGEHTGVETILSKKGITLKDVLNQIKTTTNSDISNVRLFRKSVAVKQKELILSSLKELEANALTTGSSTVEEANIRKQESQAILNFIDRAKNVEPLGQVVLHDNVDLSTITLEDGDRLDIPSKNQTILVQGEVLAPTAQVFVSGYSVDDYIDSTGGFNFRADKEKVLLIHTNGVVSKYDASSFVKSKPVVKSGDSILVLGKVDEKRFQMAKDITQVMYQIAVGAAVAIAAF